jgi:hypothetical protein
MENETYIGHGVYVSHDGFVFWLRTPRENGDHLIALEDGALSSLVAYARHVYASPTQQPTATPEEAISAAFGDGALSPPEPTEALKAAAARYSVESRPYGHMCMSPELCAGKGYCPRDPTCGD